MSKEQIIKVAIIGDHNVLRKCVCQYLQSLGFEIAFDAENGAVALEKMETRSMMPDVCVVDINMSVMNGFDLTEALHKKYPTVKIVAFSLNGNERYLIKMLECGADGFVEKGTNTSELEDAIKVIYNGGRYFSTRVSETAKSYFSTQFKKSKK